MLKFFALQMAIVLLIALGVGLVIAFSSLSYSQKEWEENKALIFLCAGGCLVLLIIIGGLIPSFVK